MNRRRAALRDPLRSSGGQHEAGRFRRGADFLSSAGFERFAVDTHLYLMEYLWRTGNDDLDAYLRHVREEFAPTVSEMSRRFPLIIGELCIDTTSTKAGPPRARRTGCLLPSAGRGTAGGVAGR
jgi:hypothetical protein